MSFHQLLFFFGLFLLLVQHVDSSNHNNNNNERKIVVFVGDVGAGKSATVNWFAERSVAKEGDSFQKETLVVSSYELADKPGFVLVDSPGFEDTQLTDDDFIRNMIQVECLRIIGLDGAGAIIVVVFDGSTVRLPIKKVLEQVVQIFSRDALPSIIISVNKLNKLELSTRNKVMEFVVEQAKSYGIQAHQVLDLDAKGASKENMHAFRSIIEKTPTLEIAEGVKQLKSRLEQLFQAELDNPDNYNSITHKGCVAKTRSITKTLYEDHIYQVQCNCRMVRKGLFRRRKQVCETCNETEKVPRQVTETEDYVECNPYTTKALRNDEAIYRELALQKLMKEVTQLHMVDISDCQ
jgi:GTP-binding protein EngB required for normal cell division